MRILLGMVLLITGLFVGAQVYLPDTAFQAPPLTVPAVGPSRVREIALVAGPARVFRTSNGAMARPVPRASEPAFESTSVAEAPSSWETEVTVSPELQRRMTSSTPGDSTTRYELVRDLQRELKRVGCYWGKVDGSWGSGSKRAMSEFTERVNAALPMNEPDYILLSLVQNHPGQVCGSDCPAGQDVGSGGRCVPRAVLAQSARKSGRTPSHVAVAVPKPVPARNPAKKFAAPATATAVVAAAPTGKDRRIVAAPAPRPVASQTAEVLPWQRAGSAKLATNELAGRVVDELPGRMSIGGPAAPAPRAAALTGTASRSAPPVTGNAPGKAEKLAALENAPDSGDSGSVGTVIPPSTHVAKPRRARSASADPPRAKRRNKAHKTSFWRPRAGTPRYNLMLSLGGSF